MGKTPSRTGLPSVRRDPSYDAVSIGPIPCSPSVVITARQAAKLAGRLAARLEGLPSPRFPFRGLRPFAAPCDSYEPDDEECRAILEGLSDAPANPRNP